MIYIISGASRSGKTKAARILFEKTNIPFISVDHLMMGFAGGMFDTGIHPENWPDKNAELMWPFLKNTIICMIEDGKDYIFEGEEFLPGLVNEVIEMFPKKVKHVYMGYVDISVIDKVKMIKAYPNPNDWLVNHMEDYIENHVKNMIEYSKRIKAMCKEHNAWYYDTSKDFTESINTLVEQLMK